MQSTDKQVVRWLLAADLAKTDPWIFLRNFTFTMDEHDPLNPVCKPFPIRAYSRVVLRFWKSYDVAFIEKSRQIRMTWEIAALCLWDAMFHQGRRIFFQSKKQEDADGILDRARLMYDNLADMSFPDLPKVKQTGQKSGTTSELEFLDLKSIITAIPQGGSILRSWTSSRIFGDEVAFQPDADEAYAAAHSTIKGGGQYLGASTPNGKGFNYQQMYAIDERTGAKIGENVIDSRKVGHPKWLPRFTGDPNNPAEVESYRRAIDKLIVEMDEEVFQAIPFEELAAAVPGMAYWETCTGVHCLRVHYSADPEKSPDTEAGRAWVANEKKGCSNTTWLREYEINYDTYEGRPVVSNWQHHIFVKKPLYDVNCPLRLTNDFGTICCLTFFAQYVPVPGYNVYQLRFLDEIVLRHPNANTPALGAGTVEILEQRYRPSWENNRIYAYCDPNGGQERATNSDRSENTDIKIMNTFGIYPTSRKFGVPESTRVLETVFGIQLPNGEPAVVIHERCEYLIGCLSGGLHYPKDGGRPGYYEKDGEWDHGGDGARYMIANCFTQFDLTGGARPPSTRVVALREKYTGRILGYKKINLQRRPYVHQQV